MDIPILRVNGTAHVQRWEHPQMQTLIDIDYDERGLATITEEGLTALLRAAGWRRVK